jgi:sucrose-6-phosphate hydrolase SacC (GH32 family)
MVTVLPDQQKVRFDASTDLKHWTHLSDFGPAGATEGLWECPDLFELPVEGEQGRTKWVLKVDVLRGIGAQYFIGEFDGT